MYGKQMGSSWVEQEIRGYRVTEGDLRQLKIGVCALGSDSIAQVQSSKWARQLERTGKGVRSSGQIREVLTSELEESGSEIEQQWLCI